MDFIISIVKGFIDFHFAMLGFMAFITLALFFLGIIFILVGRAIELLTSFIRRTL